MKNVIQRMLFITLLFVCQLSFASVIKVGTGVSGPPLVEGINTSDGRFYFGFCIDLMNEICKRIGEHCTYQPVTPDNQFELLDGSKIDLLILTSPYGSFDLKNYAFSIPYAASKIRFLVLQNSPIHGITDMQDKKIGVINKTFYKLLTETSFSLENQIIPYDRTPDLLSDLAHNKIDIIVLNNAIAHNLERNIMYNVKTVGPSIPLGEGYGIIGLSDKAAVIEKIN